MRVKRLNSDKEVSVNVRKYKLDWDWDGDSSLEIQFRDLIYPYWANNYIVLFQYTIPGSLLKIDFLNVNKRLAIEIDGPQHNKWNKFFFKNSRANYLASIKRDLQKDKWCEDNNIRMLHLNEEDLKQFSPIYIEKNYGVSVI